MVLVYRDELGMIARNRVASMDHSGKIGLRMQNLVVILGTNASGKSELGIRLANHLGGEVVSADSRQVYRGLDLGSGKITPAQAGTVKHHLIDVAELSEYFSLAQYQRAAYSAIDSISASRQKAPARRRNRFIHQRDRRRL